MRMQNWLRTTLLGAMLCGSTFSGMVAVAAEPLTYNKVVEYLELEVKEARLLKMISDSNTHLQLSEKQIAALKQKGASDELIAALCAPGGDAVEVVESAGPRPAATASTLKPSKDGSAPSPLEVGQYIAGRLAAGKAHYVALELPEGDYVAVGDLKLADGSHSNLQLGVQMDGNKLFGTNDVDRATRGAAKFHSDGGKHAFTIENDSSIVDYHFGVFAADSVPFPYIAFAKGTIQELTLGKRYSVKLDPKTLTSRSAYFHFHLDEGDYAMEFLFRSPKATGNYGVDLYALDSYAVPAEKIGYAYSSEKSLAVKKKLIVADAQDRVVRVTCFDDAPIEGSLSIVPLKGDAE